MGQPKGIQDAVKIVVDYGEFFQFPSASILEATPWGQVMTVRRSGSDGTVQLRVLHDCHFTGQGLLPPHDLSQCEDFFQATFIVAMIRLALCSLGHRLSSSVYPSTHPCTVQLRPIVVLVLHPPQCVTNRRGVLRHSAPMLRLVRRFVYSANAAVTAMGHPAQGG